MTKTMTPPIPLDGAACQRRRPGWLNATGLSALIAAAAVGVVLPIPWPAPAGPVAWPSYEHDLISSRDLLRSLGRPDAPIIVDVRHPSLYASGHLPWAINFPMGVEPPDLHKVPLGVRLALYCS